MDIENRIKLYEALEDYRKTPLIVYATSTRQGVPALIASDAVRQLIDQIDNIKDKKAVDILIHSSGGDALAAWKLMSILREQFETVNVLVPFMAFSAATIFALGANEIVMHPYASLGPIDPQITATLPDGTKRQFAYEDVGAFLRFLSEEVGITEQAYTSPLVDKIFSAVDPLVIGAAKRASELSTSVGERLLKLHLKDGDKDAAKQIAEKLNKSFFAHGDAVSRTRARELNLRVAKDDPVLEGLLWDAYLGLESYMQLRKPFVPIQHYLADSTAKATLAPTSPLILPPNTPPQLLEQMWNNIAQQSINRLSQPATQVDYTLIHAVIESARVSSEYFTLGKVSATRMVGGDIQVSVLTEDGGWRNNEASDKEKEKA